MTASQQEDKSIIMQSENISLQKKFEEMASRVAHFQVALVPTASKTLKDAYLKVHFSMFYSNFNNIDKQRLC